MPVIQTLYASRNATWGPTLVYDYPGEELPLAGAKIAMQLRLYPGQPGEPKLAIGDIPFTDVFVPAVQEDLAHHPEPISARPAHRRLALEPLFTVTQLSALPGLQTPEAGSSQSFAFDIRITYADGVSEILSSGTFVVSPGVTTI